MGEKQLCIRFSEIDGFIKPHDGIRYLVLFGLERYNANYNRIRYFIIKECGITDIISPKFERITIDLYNFLPIEKARASHNVIILIESVVNKNENNCY